MCFDHGVGTCVYDHGVDDIFVLLTKQSVDIPQL